MALIDRSPIALRYALMKRMPRLKTASFCDATYGGTARFRWYFKTEEFKRVVWLEIFSDLTDLSIYLQCNNPLHNCHHVYNHYRATTVEFFIFIEAFEAGELYLCNGILTATKSEEADPLKRHEDPLSVGLDPEHKWVQVREGSGSALDRIPL